MADQFSFDVVSEVNMQELRNVVDQATKEVKQRFDFKDSKTEITLKEKEKELVILSDDEYKLNAVIDIIKTKCTKRGVSLKAFDYGAIEPALSGTVRQTAKIQSGIVTEKAKEITKAVKESKLKVQAQIQGEQVRVLSKSKDDLQATMTFLKGQGFWHRSAVYQLQVTQDAETDPQLRSQSIETLNVHATARLGARFSLRPYWMTCLSILGGHA